MDGTSTDAGKGILHHPKPNPSDQRADTARPSALDPSPLDPSSLVAAAIAVLRPAQRARLDELGVRRLERAAQPLVGGWTPIDLATRIGADRVDRAENLAAVLASILRRYALEPPPGRSAPPTRPRNGPAAPSPR